MIKELIPLAKDTISNDEIDSLCNWLKTYPKLTKGVQTIEFERMWAEWLGSKYAVFVNSGSSANLLMLYVLLLSGRLKNHKVAIPTLSWATDYAPVLQLGMEPVLIDCNLDNLSVDLEHLEKMFIKHSPSILILVSVLGFVPDMEKISKLCNEYGVILLEDVCESQGSRFSKRKLGTFGLMSSFSLFYGHIMSSIEGGLVCTDDKEMYDLIVMARSHGWDRDLSPDSKSVLRTKWKVNDFNSMYQFYIPGFNLRSTDLQAYIAKGQLLKVDKIIQKRNENYFLINSLIKNNYWKPVDLDNAFISNFCYPIIHPKRDDIVQKLIENNVEVRPLICGSLGTQPMYVKKFGKLEFKNASIVDKFGCYIPNNPSLTEDEIHFMCDVINSVIN